MNEHNPAPSARTAPPPSAPLFRRNHCFWLLVTAQVCFLIFIATHYYYTIHERSHLKTIWNSRRAEEIGAEQTRVQFEGLIKELLQMARTNVHAAALAAKYDVKP